MDNIIVFDSTLSERAKEEGIARACSPEERLDWLDEAKAAAVHIGRLQDEVSMDDVARLFFLEDGIDICSILGNSCGSIFRSKYWERVGFKKSERVRRHSNIISVWRLRIES